MTKFLTGLIVAVLTNDKVKALIKSLLQDVVKEDVMPALPIGMAMCMGWDGDGLAVWRLTIRGADVPSRWVIVDQEFRPVEE